jgi:hypothetical protein
LGSHTCRFSIIAATMPDTMFTPGLKVVIGSHPQIDGVE